MGRKQEPRKGLKQEHHGVGFTVEHDGMASDYSRMWHFMLAVDGHYLRSMGRFTSRRRAVACAKRLIDRLVAKGLAAEVAAEWAPCPRCGGYTAGCSVRTDAGRYLWRVECTVAGCGYRTGYHHFDESAWWEHSQNVARAAARGVKA